MPVQERAFFAVTMAALIVILAAVSHVRNNIWIDELVLFSDTISKSPSKLRIHGTIGMQYALHGMSGEAIREYMYILDRQPWRADMRSNLGVEYLKLGRLEDAEREIKQTIGKKRLAGLSSMNLGNVYYAKGDLREAINWYLRSFDESGSKNVTVLQNAGFAYIDLKQYADAAKVFEKTLVADGTSVIGHYGLALAYDEAGDYVLALKYWRRFLELASGGANYAKWADIGRERLYRLERRYPNVR